MTYLEGVIEHPATAQHLSFCPIHSQNYILRAEFLYAGSACPALKCVVRPPQCLFRITSCTLVTYEVDNEEAHPLILRSYGVRCVYMAAQFFIFAPAVRIFRIGRVGCGKQKLNVAPRLTLLFYGQSSSDYALS